MHSGSGDYTYTTRPGDLRRFDLRTADDHQTEQDRRLAMLEATNQEHNRRMPCLSTGWRCWKMRR